MRDKNGRFIKGNQSWLKGTKGLIKNKLKGKKLPWKEKLRKPKSISHPKTEEQKEAIRKRMIGNKNGWKGGFKGKSRRERMLMTEGQHTYGEWDLLKKQYGYTCPACKKAEPEIKLTEDHIIPISKGGSNFIENIQPLCFICNCKKHTKIIKY